MGVNFRRFIFIYLYLGQHHNYPQPKLLIKTQKYTPPPTNIHSQSIQRRIITARPSYRPGNQAKTALHGSPAEQQRMEKTQTHRGAGISMARLHFLGLARAVREEPNSLSRVYSVHTHAGPILIFWSPAKSLPPPPRKENTMLAPSMTLERVVYKAHDKRAGARACISVFPRAALALLRLNRIAYYTCLSACNLIEVARGLSCGG